MEPARTRLIRSRPTVAGATLGVLVLGVGFAALHSGNNLLVLVLAGLCAVVVIAVGVGEWNLRGVQVDRRLPDEAFAGQAVVGAYVVRNRRRWGAIHLLRLTETHGASGAALSIRVAPGASCEVPVRWTFPVRGRVVMHRVRLVSAWPFGLWSRIREVEQPVEMLVYPTPLIGEQAAHPGSVGTEHEDPRAPGREGDFRGLRPYVPGDPMRDIHWPTSARTRACMVVVRGAVTSDEVLVLVPDRVGFSWEQGLAQAAGEIVRHFKRGRAVGLAMGNIRLPPRTGPAWRRRLLGCVALAPVRLPGEKGV